MNIEKAMELLRQDLNSPGSVDIMDLNQAQELGIEALKRCQHADRFTFEGKLNLLPGETERNENEH